MTERERGNQNLRGLRIFVAEDEFLVLMLVEDMLDTLGCKVTATATRLDDAMRVATEDAIDVAILDVNLGGAKIYSVAEVLSKRDIPVVFSTGYGNAGLDAPWGDRPVLQKPYRVEQLERVLISLTAGRDRN